MCEDIDERVPVSIGRFPPRKLPGSLLTLGPATQADAGLLGSFRQTAGRKQLSYDLRGLLSPGD